MQSCAMRQFVRLLRRPRDPMKKPVILTAAGASLPANPKDRRRGLARLRGTVEETRPLTVQLQNSPYITAEYLAALPVMQRSLLLQEELRKRKEFLKKAIETSLNEKKELFHDALTSRRIRFNDMIGLRRKRMREFIQLHKDDIEETIILKRLLLQEALQARRERLRQTEEKFIEQSRLIVEDLREAKNKVKERMDEVIEKENIYTIPNLLCVSRIVCSPYLGYLIVTENFQYALVFMVIAGFTDWVDGVVARNFKSQSTMIGSFLDPMADKILVGTLFLTLTYVDLIPVALTGLILARDVALVGAGFVIRYKSLSPPRTLSRYFDASHATAQLAPTLISKINTGIQLSFVGFTLAAPVFGYVGHPALAALGYLTATTTILSALSYLTSSQTYRYLSQR